MAWGTRRRCLHELININANSSQSSVKITSLENKKAGENEPITKKKFPSINWKFGRLRVLGS